MKYLLDRITVAKLAVIVLLTLTITAIYSFYTKEFLASDSFYFLLKMISSNHIVDFYTDRQFANYFTQILPFLAYKYNLLNFNGLVALWGISFVFIPLIILLISLKDFSKSYKSLNSFLVIVITFYMLMSCRWISESIICLVLTIYIYSTTSKNKTNLIEDLVVCLFSILLIKSYSTTAFTNFFLIYILVNKKTGVKALKYCSIIFLAVGIIWGWKSILYPFFPTSSGDILLEVKSFISESFKQVHLIIIGLCFILIGLIRNSRKILYCALIPFSLQLLPIFWLRFSELLIYRYFLSFPFLIILIALSVFKNSSLNDKYLSLVLVFGMLSVVPSMLWRSSEWNKTILKYRTFYENEVGEVNIYNSDFQEKFQEGYLRWEGIFYQLLFKKNSKLNLYYKGPGHESWVQEDFERHAKVLRDKGWRK